jgi:hypothetical protein
MVRSATVAAVVAVTGSDTAPGKVAETRSVFGLGGVVVVATPGAGTAAATGKLPTAATAPRPAVLDEAPRESLEAMGTPVPIAEP